MRAEDFDVVKLIENLQGTCEALDKVLESLYPGMTSEDLTEDDHDAIDQEIFKCETCDWWYEQGESGDAEGNCLNCNNEIDEEE